jgi:hypothetical protein
MKSLYIEPKQNGAGCHDNRKQLGKNSEIRNSCYADKAVKQLGKNPIKTVIAPIRDENGCHDNGVKQLGKNSEPNKFSCYAKGLVHKALIAPIREEHGCHDNEVVNKLGKNSDPKQTKNPKWRCHGNVTSSKFKLNGGIKKINKSINMKTPSKLPSKNRKYMKTAMKLMKIPIYTTLGGVGSYLLTSMLPLQTTSAAATALAFTIKKLFDSFL